MKRDNRILAILLVYVMIFSLYEAVKRTEIHLPEIGGVRILKTASERVAI